MSQAQGSSISVAFQEETTEGQIPSSIALTSLPLESGSPKAQWNLIKSKILSSDRNPKRASRGNTIVNATFKTELGPTMGTVLKGVLGANTPAGAGSPYTHTIKVASTLPSFLFQVGFSDIALYALFHGCKFNRLTIDAATEGPIALGIDLVGMCMTQALRFDAQSAAFNLNALLTGAGGSTGTIHSQNDAGTAGILALLNATGDFVNDEAITDDGSSAGAAVANGTLGDTSIDASITDPGHTAFDGPSVLSITDGGSTVLTGITKINAVVNNNCDISGYVFGGGGKLGSIPAGALDINGTMEALFDSVQAVALFKKALRYTETSLEMVMRNGTGAGTAGNEQLTLTWPELQYAAQFPEATGPFGIKLTLPFEAHYRADAATSAVWAELKNQSATL